MKTGLTPEERVRFEAYRESFESWESVPSDVEWYALGMPADRDERAASGLDSVRSAYNAWLRDAWPHVLGEHRRDDLSWGYGRRTKPPALGWKAFKATLAPAEIERMERDVKRGLAYEAARDREMHVRMWLHEADDLPLRRWVVAAIALGEALETKSTAAVRSWWHEHEDRPVLVLAGGPGCGKTVAACAHVLACRMAWSSL